MNTYIIGLIAGIAGIILDAILPIVFQEGNVEIFSFLFVLSFVFIVITSIYMVFYTNRDFSMLYKQLLDKSTDINILFFGGLRYLKYVLFTFGALHVNPGLYSALLCFETAIYSIYSHIQSDTIPKPVEFAGYGLVVLFLTAISTLFVQEKSGARAKQLLLYAIFAITVAMGADFIDSSYFAKLDKDPFEDIELSSLAMFILSICVVVYRIFFVKGGLSSFMSLFQPSHLLYIIGIAIFACDYIPSLLEFTTYDWLNPTTIMALFTSQSVIGFLLDRFYYGQQFSTILLFSIVGLLVGALCITIGQITSADKTDFSAIKHARTNRAFDGISVHKAIQKSKSTGPQSSTTPQNSN